MARKQHIAKPGNTGTSAQRTKCGAIMIPGMKVSGGHCKRCETIDAREHRAWLGAHDAMWRSARGLSVSTGIPHCVIGQFDGTPLQIVPASFNCATDGPRAIAACGACYPIDPKTGKRIEACPFCGSKNPSAAHLANCHQICGGVTTAETQISDEIECAKSDLRAKLVQIFTSRVVDQAEAAELTDEIDAIVSRANNHRGTYRETNACLGCEITAHSDEDPRNPATVHFKGADSETLCGMPPRDLDGAHHRAISYDDGDSTCPQCNAYVQRTIDDAADEREANDGGVSLIGTPYTPSPAIVAMVEFANANPTWSTSQRYRTFTVLIAGIRAERPDWSREQARDWLRAQS